MYVSGVINVISRTGHVLTCGLVVSSIFNLCLTIMTFKFEHFPGN